MMNTRTPLKLLSVMSLLLVTATFGCDDESFNTRESAVLEVMPNEFVFPPVEIGSDAIEKIVQVKNVGDSDLVLGDFRATFRRPESYQLDYRVYNLEDGLPAVNEYYQGIDANGNEFRDSVTVLAGQALALKLRYVPDMIGAEGVVRFQSNTDAGEVTIPVVGDVARGDIIAEPATVDFGRVNVGDARNETITLRNIGNAPVSITNVFLSGLDDYSLLLNDEPAIGSIEEIPTLGDPDGDGVPGLSGGKSATFTVIYSPTSDTTLPGEVEFAFTNAVQESISVQLLANGASPCINLLFPDSVSTDTSTLQFGPALIGATTPSEVIVESCGGQALEVTSITYEGDAEFALAEGTAPFTLPGRTDTRPTNSFTLNFSPTDAEVYEGVLVITSNDPANLEMRIPVLGRGTLNACPEAVVTNERLDVLPLEIITLDASNSVDPDGPSGQPVSYEWVVVSRPDGSTAQPVERFFNPLRPADGGNEDDLSTPTAQFFVDLAGEYVFNLVVTDDLGFSAPSNTCPQAEARLVVNSLPDEDIHVELTWTTPGDPNETDTEGTDVDLHFRHPNGQRWNQSPYDCYFANPNPDWGPTGDVGNPSLDIDDVNGAGPENINLNDPEYTDQTTIPGPYLVGVHYYSSGGLFTADYGASEATIRLYLGGALAGTYTRVLNSTGNFWEVAGVIWTTAEQRVQEIDRFYNTPPW